MLPGRTLQLTRLQGLALEALTGLALAAALARSLGGPVWWAAAGALLGLAVGLRWTPVRAALAVEGALPDTRHALRAWLEGAGGALRPRLTAWLEARARVPLLWGGLLRTALALTLWAWAPMAGAPGPAPGQEAPPSGALAAPTVRAQVHVEPPPYSRLPARDAPGPLVKALRGSQLTVTWFTAAPVVVVAEPGEPELRLATAGGRVEQAVLLVRTRTLRATTTGGEALAVLTLEAVRDQAPEVELLAPAEDRVVATAPAPFLARAAASDDLGVARASLRFTLSQGTGEGVRFRTGTLPSRSRTEGAALVVEGRVDPAALGLSAGDTLVVWAEALDGNALDGPSVGRSGARLLRWEVPLPELGGGTGAMPPPPRSLLTQRELLARTERLVRRGLAGGELARASAQLAIDQRSLRVSFGQVLNADTGDGLALDFDEKEVAESTDTRAHALLAQAVSAMWDSEAALDLGQPRASLAPQRAAVAALDAAFQLVRMSLRPLGRPLRPVDEGRRLTGAAGDLRPGPVALPPAEVPGPRLVDLALALLGGAARGLEVGEARALGDALWALPPASGVPAVELAAALYGAGTAEARAGAARLAGEALARRVHPARLAVPPLDPAGARLLARLPLASGGAE